MSRLSRREFLGASAAVGIAGVAGCSGGGSNGQQPSSGQGGLFEQGSNAGWRGWGGDPQNSWARTGTTAVTTVGDETWRYESEGLSGLFSVVDGRVYVYDDSGVYAVDAATGELEWEQTVAGYAGAGPTVAGGRVYLGTDEGRVAAFDAADGTEQWTVERREPFDSPAVVDGTVYVVGDRVYALDAESGDVVWAQAVAGDPEGAIPAVGDGSLYTRGGEGRIVALETSDGSERWEFTREGRTFRTPAVVDGRVYVGEAGQEQAEVSLRVLDAGTGELDWAFATREFASAPAVGDGSAYIATGTDEVVGLDAAGGAEQWRFGDGERVIGPSLFGNTVYVSTGGSRLRGLASGDGSEQLSVRVGEETSVGTPVVRNGRLYARVGNAIRAYGSA